MCRDLSDQLRDNVADGRRYDMFSAYVRELKQYYLILRAVAIDSVEFEEDEYEEDDGDELCIT